MKYGYSFLFLVYFYDKLFILDKGNILSYDNYYYCCCCFVSTDEDD